MISAISVRATMWMSMLISQAGVSLSSLFEPGGGAFDLRRCAGGDGGGCGSRSRRRRCAGAALAGAGVAEEQAAERPAAERWAGDSLNARLALFGHIRRRGRQGERRCRCAVFPLFEQPHRFALLLLRQLDAGPAIPAVGSHQPEADGHRRPAVGAAHISTSPSSQSVPGERSTAACRSALRGRTRRAGPEKPGSGGASGSSNGALEFRSMYGTLAAGWRAHRRPIRRGQLQREIVKADLLRPEAMLQLRILSLRRHAVHQVPPPGRVARCQCSTSQLDGRQEGNLFQNLVRNGTVPV